MALPEPDRASTWGGRMIVDRLGATIGACTQVYTDDATGLPEWATARMGSLIVVVPLVDAVEDADQVRIAVGRDEVILAPVPTDRHHLSEDDEARLYRHYGIAFSRDRSPSILPTAEPVPASLARDGADGRDAADRADGADRAVGRGRWLDRKHLLLAAGLTAGLLGVLAGVLSALSRRQRFDHPGVASARSPGRR